jgi:hypothetical protein
MGDDPRRRWTDRLPGVVPAAPTTGDLLAAIDMLRGDYQGAIEQSEGRVVSAITSLRNDFTSWTGTHLGLHGQLLEERDTAHRRYDAFIRTAEIDQARKAGALGILRFTLDLVGRNWRLVAIVLAAVFALFGNVHFQIVAS